jgi:hypothetical protein
MVLELVFVPFRGMGDGVVDDSVTMTRVIATSTSTIPGTTSSARDDIDSPLSMPGEGHHFAGVLI